MLLLLASNTVNLFITPNPTAYSLFTTSFYQMDLESMVLNLERELHAAKADKDQRDKVLLVKKLM